MKKINILLNGLLLGMAAACTPKEVTEITVSPEVINADYIGNGAEWDPYDEAEAWGSSISDEDWKTLYKRLDFMKPQYVRCMINSPYRYYDSESGKYDKTRNIESISRLLEYCTKQGITVIYGEYNPPTWDMKEDQKWVDIWSMISVSPASSISSSSTNLTGAGHPLMEIMKCGKRCFSDSTKRWRNIPD
mgnify:CR=1 FL=1